MPEEQQPLFTAVSGFAAFTQSAIEMLGKAKMEIALFSQDLDRRVYGDERFVSLLKTFLLAHRRARLRCLIHSPRLAVRSGHRLIELGRVLSSRIEFRQLLEERQKLREEYLICDESSLLFRQSPGDLDARYYQHAPLHVRGQLRSFNSVWDESPPARELSELKI